MLERAEGVEPGGQVVALDVRDDEREARLGDHPAHLVRQPGGVEPARVDHQARAALGQQAHRVGELGQEAARVAQRGILGALEGELAQRRLGEVVAGDDVDGSREGVAQTGEPVPEPAGAVGDADRTVGVGVGHGPGVSLDHAASLSDAGHFTMRAT